MAFFWEKLLRPMMFAADAEHAHELGIKAMKLGFASPFYCENNAFGFSDIERFGLNFPNPIGVAGGFDKNGLIVDELASLGFGFVEVGTVTYEPQPGNPKPRLFRLAEAKALINRLGFNNDGAVAVAERLSNVRRQCVIGINIGRNKDVANEDAIENYIKCFETILAGADYVAVNVSSPNTPNLRDLQRLESLNSLLAALQQSNSGKPLLVKIAPDLTDGEVTAIVDVCRQNNVAGIIATNTTIARDGLTVDSSEIGDGGLSGKPLTDRSNDVISTIYRYSDGNLPIIGVGGVLTAEDAFNKIAYGASLVQAYTGFVYGGPSFARDINRGLIQLLEERGFASLDEAIGSAVS